MISVVIPTYKHGDFILKTLDSVFAQTFTDYEVIVINDGSPDDTEQILQPLIKAGRIRYIHQRNEGQGAARNRGIAEAKGEFIALLDDDDLWPPDKLQWQAQALEQNPKVALVYGRPLCIDSQGLPLSEIPTKADGSPVSWLKDGPSGQVFDSFIQDNWLVSPGQCLIRRASLLALGPNPFDPHIRYGCDDWDLYIRLAREFDFLYCDRVSLYYRFHATNASKDNLRLNWSGLMVRRKIFRTETNPELYRKFRDAYLIDLKAYKSYYFEAVRKQTSQKRASEQIALRMRINALSIEGFAIYISQQTQRLGWRVRESLGKMKSIITK